MKFVNIDQSISQSLDHDSWKPGTITYLVYQILQQPRQQFNATKSKMSTKQASLRRRLACDRCHSFKLKCPRSALNNDDECARCLKSGVSCSYSLSMRGQVRPRRPPTVTTSSSVNPVNSLNNGIDSDISMSNFNANGIFT